jgi:hypothetical protein
MKRDLDLVRKILEKLEEKPQEITQQLKIDNYSDSEIMYHFIIMDEAGLIRCEREVSKSSKITLDRVIRVYPFGLTWQGHEFLEIARNDDIWKKAKDIAKSKLGALPFDVIKALLISMTKNMVGL